jgi:hypothetical protein
MMRNNTTMNLWDEIFVGKRRFAGARPSNKQHLSTTSTSTNNQNKKTNNHTISVVLRVKLSTPPSHNSDDDAILCGSGEPHSKRASFSPCTNKKKNEIVADFSFCV